ncbi:MAG: tRNA pseudouridine(38-40) synthase TruA [Lachnospiraceae bacterium]|nr:tRNA pseudouridine(38-40) synthase TruA [Lachnospiraceae bacterium]
MRRIMLTIAYDGTNYSGWQIQPDKPTIEGVLNTELSKLFNEEVHVIGASRTDAGVHAEGAVAVFDTESTIPGDRYPFVINQVLPDDICIMESKQVSDDFHPRKINCRKTYEYRIYNDTFIPPLKRLYYHHVYGKLDIDVMNEAAKYLVGEHDFVSFSCGRSYTPTTVRTIYDLSVRREDKEVIISVTGNGFLYNMVRIISGTLIEIGQGKYSPQAVNDILEKKDRTSAGQTVPAKGLCLVRYDFF